MERVPLFAAFGLHVVKPNALDPYAGRAVPVILVLRICA
jgi:hypothetical protein